jgi:SAM-dependent methyltransferase
MTLALLPKTAANVLAPAPGPALSAYESCAQYYDLLTADYDHEAWLECVERLALEAGFPGRLVLDVGCGTGKSAAPMLSRGYDVWACDLSPAMVRRARLRLGGGATVFVADMRELPDLPEFGLLTCLDDAVNYLVGPGDLDAAMASFADALAPGGVAVFDVNTAATYRDLFATDCVFEAADGRLRWRGQGRALGGHYSAVVEPVAGSGQGGRSSVHVQRHHPRGDIAAACDAAGLEIVRVVGQSSGCVLSDRIDEDEQSKLLYVVRKPARRWSA